MKARFGEGFKLEKNEADDFGNVLGNRSTEELEQWLTAWKDDGDNKDRAYIDLELDLFKLEYEKGFDSNLEL